ncbi:MAG: DUF6599 family protein [Sedimentisphaeraceae bacterium JB056]
MSENKLNRTVETLVSIITMAVIVVIVAVILYMQGHYDLGRFGIITGEDAVTGQVSESSGGFAVSDKFTVLSEAEVYSPDTLYEKINGKAPLYTEAGFEELLTQRYTFTAQPDIWVEIYRYRMSTPKAAFYVYSTQKRAKARPVEGLSAEHFYKTTSGMYMAAGNDYFEISASAENEEMLDALAADISDIAMLESPENSLLPVPEVLPDSNAVEGSFKMYLDGAFGIGGLGEVYIRDYELDGRRMTIFVIPDGENAAAKFESFMAESGAEKVSDEDGIDVYDLFGVYELIMLNDGSLIGVHEADDYQAAIELIKMLIGGQKDE